MPMKPCAAAGCRSLVAVGETHCRAHASAVAVERWRQTDVARKDRPSRKWYNSKAWRGPGGRRARQLAAEPLCAMCPEWSRQPATIADHVEPHRDDHGKFWFGPLQSLCKSCHDIKKQRIERRARAGGGTPKSDAKPH